MTSLRLFIIIVEDACRQNWRSILDSKRYYSQKRRAPKKSGSGCDLELLSDESEDPWEFSEELEFMTDTSELRTYVCINFIWLHYFIKCLHIFRTICSQLLASQESEQSQDVDFDDIEVLPNSASMGNKPSYTYVSRNVPK